MKHDSDVSGALAPAHELLIEIVPRGMVCWRGSRAQIEAEGVVPGKVKWPERDVQVRWSAAGFSFELGRCRPDGMKGPKSAWVSGDYWVLRRWLSTERDRGWQSSRIYAARQELEFELWIKTPKWGEQLNRSWRAECDEAFQTFKASIPGLIKPKRGRRRAAEMLRTRP